MPITWRKPDPDDPIFSAAFVVSFPIQFETSTDAGQPTSTPPEPDENQEWTIDIPIGPVDSSPERDEKAAQ